jgi:hypothetical protein
MESVRGIRTCKIKLEKKKGGLGLSIKGGAEHGIPVIISGIDKSSPAASHLNLGDELISVNGISLQRVTHKEAVDHLKVAATERRHVILTTRINHIFQDTFISFDQTTENIPMADDVLSVTENNKSINDGEQSSDSSELPLPQGWSHKIDRKTDRPYFENHYTRTSTWTDPRSLSPRPLEEFDWELLPPSWERFMDEHGDVYYVDHDTQSTHWDSPRGKREQEQLEELQDFLSESKIKLKKKEDQLKEMRNILLTKNRELDENQDGTNDIINEIMMLNEEAEELNAVTKNMRKQIQILDDILHSAFKEDIEDFREQLKASANVASDLQKLYTNYAMSMTEVQSMLGSLDEHKNDGAPLKYMLALHDINPDDKIKWIHLLGDRLTAKTNTEMRVEVCILNILLPAATDVLERVRIIHRNVMDHKRSINWDNVISQLVSLEFSVLKDDWIDTNNFR